MFIIVNEKKESTKTRKKLEGMSQSERASSSHVPIAKQSVKTDPCKHRLALGKRAGCNPIASFI